MKPFLLLLLSSMTPICFAQTFELQGTIPANQIQSEIGQITVFSLPDSSLIKGSYIDSSYFSLTIPSTKSTQFYAKLGLPGYSDTIINFERTNQTIINLGIISLEKDMSLATVDIVYRQPIYTRTIDGIKVKVDGTTLERLSSLFDVLKSSPQILSPDDESIEIIGKGVPLILIDRQPILSNEELKAIPANMIDRIEIITNPSAKYKAQGRENGVIEVYTKNFRLEGYNMSINAQGGVVSQGTPIGSLGITYSLKKGKFSLSASAYGRYFEQTNYGSLNRVITDSSKRTSFWDNTDDHSAYSQNVNVKSAYQINEKQTLSGGIRSSAYNRKSHTISDGEYGVDGVSLTREVQDARDKYNWQDNSAFLNYLVLTDTNQSNLEINFNYQLKINEGSIIHLTDYTDYQTATLQAFNLRNNTKNRPNIGELRLTYEHVFDTTGWILGAGAVYSVIVNKMELDVLNLVGAEWVPDAVFSNSYDYTEQIGGVFLEVTKNWKKLNARAGIRGEYTNMDGYSHSLSKQFMDSVYVLPFPSASLMYQPSEKLAVTWRYTSGIDRPQFASFDPFVRVTDSLTREYGNPYLRPATSHNFGVDVDLFGQYRISFDQTYTVNSVAMRMFIDDSTFLYQFTPWNADGAEQTSLSFGLPLNTKWMDGYIYANATYSKFKFTPIFNLPDIKNFTYLVWTSLNFHLKGDITITNQAYVYRHADFTIAMKPRVQWDISVTKRMANDKLSISLRVSDLLPPKLNYTQNASNYESNYTGQDLFTDFQLGIFYKFGRLKRDAHIKESNAGESDRI